MPNKMTVQRLAKIVTEGRMNEKFEVTYVFGSEVGTDELTIKLFAKDGYDNYSHAEEVGRVRVKLV